MKLRTWKTGAVLVLGFGFPGLFVYWAMAPSAQVYGHITTHGPRDNMTVALTFDDGPNYPWTLRIAEVLDQHGVQGTFFLVGQNVDANPGLARLLVEHGHLVGNHSYHHRKRDAVLDFGYGDLNQAENSIASATGVCAALYRSPNGFHTPWQMHAVSSHHMQAIGWDVQPNDWEHHNADKLVQSVVNAARPGSIIALHDGEDTRVVTDRSTTLSALPGIIEGLRSKGYRIVRLDELLSVQPYLSSCAH